MASIGFKLIDRKHYEICDTKVTKKLKKWGRNSSPLRLQRDALLNHFFLSNVVSFNNKLERRRMQSNELFNVLCVFKMRILFRGIFTGEIND